MTQAALDPYPLSVRGELDPGTNRFMFLVKWILLIPHWIVLSILGFAGMFKWIASLFRDSRDGPIPPGLV